MLQPTFGVRKDGFGAQTRTEAIFSTYRVASCLRVTSWRPRGLGIGSSKARAHPLSGIDGAGCFASGVLLPAEIRTDIGTAPAAGLAGKSRLNVGQAHVIRPLFGAVRRPMAALVIRAIDQDPAQASGAQFCEGYLFGAGELGHAPLQRGRSGETIPRAFLFPETLTFEVDPMYGPALR